MHDRDCIMMTCKYFIVWLNTWLTGNETRFLLLYILWTSKILMRFNFTRFLLESCKKIFLQLKYFYSDPPLWVMPLRNLVSTGINLLLLGGGQSTLESLNMEILWSLSKRMLLVGVSDIEYWILKKLLCIILLFKNKSGVSPKQYHHTCCTSAVLQCDRR